jgi:hypothetical protein
MLVYPSHKTKYLYAWVIWLIKKKTKIRVQQILT